MTPAEFEYLTLATESESGVFLPLLLTGFVWIPHWLLPGPSALPAAGTFTYRWRLSSFLSSVSQAGSGLLGLRSAALPSMDAALWAWGLILIVFAG